MHSRATLLTTLLFVYLASASIFSPFFSVLDPLDGQISENGTAHELLKRQSNACPTSYSACTNQGAPGLCCGKSQVCTADSNGYVACCPTGASCTGTITGIVTGGSIAGGGTLATSTGSALLTSGVSSIASSTSNGLVMASTTASASTGTDTTTGGFIIAASTTVATIGSDGTKNVQIPLYAHLIIRALEYLPL